MLLGELSRLGKRCGFFHYKCCFRHATRCNT